MPQAWGRVFELSRSKAASHELLEGLNGVLLYKLETGLSSVRPFLFCWPLNGCFCRDTHIFPQNVIIKMSSAGFSLMFLKRPALRMLTFYSPTIASYLRQMSSINVKGHTIEDCWPKKNHTVRSQYREEARLR